MNIASLSAMLKKKPPFFLFITALYLLLIVFLKWNIHFRIEMALFFVGGLLGIYFLDFAEAVFNVTPSPFRTIVFAGAFCLVSFFVVSSSTSALASGLVLSLFLSLILWQAGELQVVGNLHRWYQMVNATISSSLERWGLIVQVVVFLLETVSFVRNN